MIVGDSVIITAGNDTIVYDVSGGEQLWKYTFKGQVYGVNAGIDANVHVMLIVIIQSPEDVKKTVMYAFK